MVLLPLVIVLLLVGVVYLARTRRERVATPAGGAGATVQGAKPISPVGWASLIVVLAAIAFWALTRSDLPIWYTAAIGTLAFILAIFAVTVRRDRSPLLLIPLLGVPLAGVLSGAFVLLQ